MRELNESTERPAWLSNDLNAYNSRFITNRIGRRVKLKDFYKKSNGEKHYSGLCEMKEE